MIPIKYYIMFASVIAIAGGGWYILNDWHYGPLKTCKVELADQGDVIKSKEETIKQLGIKITTIIEANKVTGFEEYFKGLNDANSSQVDHSKFIF